MPNTSEIKSGWAPPQTPLGELTTLPQTPSSEVLRAFGARTRVPSAPSFVVSGGAAIMTSAPGLHNPKSGAVWTVTKWIRYLGNTAL